MAVETLNEKEIALGIFDLNKNKREDNQLKYKQKNRKIDGRHCPILGNVEFLGHHFAIECPVEVNPS